MPKSYAQILSPNHKLKSYASIAKDIHLNHTPKPYDETILSRTVTKQGRFHAMMSMDSKTSHDSL